MFSADQARRVVETAFPKVVVKACVPYRGDFLVRVEHPLDDEKNFDPFFKVDGKTGEVQEFSVMTDGDPVEIAQAFSN